MGRSPAYYTTELVSNSGNKRRNPVRPNIPIETIVLRSARHTKWVTLEPARDGLRRLVEQLTVGDIA